MLLLMQLLQLQVRELMLLKHACASQLLLDTFTNELVVNTLLEFLLLLLSCDRVQLLRSVKLEFLLSPLLAVLLNRVDRLWLHLINKALLRQLKKQ